MLTERLAAVVTTGDTDRLTEVIAACTEAARRGADVRVFFRDESIPWLCGAEARKRIGVTQPDDARDGRADAIAEQLGELARAGIVATYACSSSMYLWGVAAADLIPAMTGVRGLIAFLADDLDGATRVLSY